MNKKNGNGANVDMKALEAYLKHAEYMKRYNQRPERKAKRTEYNRARWQRMKLAHKIAKDSGLIG